MDCHHLTGYGGPSCSQCPPGTFSPGGSLQPCQPCGPGLTSQPGAPSIAHCSCFPGYGKDGNDPTRCAVCPPGTWSTGPPETAVEGPAPSVLPCTACAAGKTGPQGATEPSQCFCAPGKRHRFGATIVLRATRHASMTACYIHFHTHVSTHSCLSPCLANQPHPSKNHRVLWRAVRRVSQ